MKKRVQIGLITAGGVLALGLGIYLLVGGTEEKVTGTSKEEPKTEEASQTGEEPAKQKEMKLPEQDKNATLPEADLALLDAKTYDAIETFYETLEDKKIEANQFEVLANKLVDNAFKGLQQHLFDGKVDFETSKELFYEANLMLTFIYESGWYTQEELEGSQWMTLMTLMTIIESHIEGREVVDYGYEIEANHLGAIVNILIADELQESMGYQINKEKQKEIYDFFGTNEEFKKKFQEILDKLSELVPASEEASSEETKE